jgi:TRAP-type mannitol/chloroaromatic compound transport system substrate-binding protein
MKRRDFLMKAAASAAVVAGAGAAGCGNSGEVQFTATGNEGAAAPAGGAAVISRKKVQWRLTSSFPRSLDTIFGGAEVLAERVSAMTGGDFQIKVYPAGEIVPGLQVLDAVQQRTVEMGQSASYYYTGKNPVLAYDCCVPFGLTARQQTAWLLEGGGLELLRPAFADFGVINFPAGNTGVQMGGWFKKELGSAEDLKGLKMRIPGLGGAVMARLGVTVQVLAGGDIFPALERGAIDATEWVGPYDDEKFGFYKVAKYYYYPGWWEPGPNLSYYVNTEAWAALPVEFQEIFRAAAQQSAVAMQVRYDARNPAALRRLLGYGVQMRRFSDDIMAIAERESLALLEEQAAADAGYRKVYEPWKKARGEAFDWWSAAELAYAQYAFKPLGS